MAYLPEDYNKGQAAAPAGGGNQTGQPIQLSSSQAQNSGQQAAPSQLNQKAPEQQNQTQTQGPKSSGMGDATKNLRQYTEQNKNVNLAQSIGKNLQGQATQVSQGIQQSGQKFQQQINPEKQRLAGAGQVVNTALDPNKSQYFAGTQQLNPEHINYTQTQLGQAAQQYYNPQVQKLDQPKQQEYQQKYQSYFQPQAPAAEGQTPAVPQVNDQLQKDYQAYKLNQLQTSTPDKYSQYQQAIADEGKKQAEQKYYAAQFGKYGVNSPQAQWDAIQQATTDEAINKQLLGQAGLRSQTAQDYYKSQVPTTSNGQSRDSYGRVTVTNPYQQELDQIFGTTQTRDKYGNITTNQNISDDEQLQRRLDELNNQYNIKAFDPNAWAQSQLPEAQKAANTKAEADRQALLDQYKVGKFDQNAYQKALLGNLGINDLTSDNAELEAQNMLASQYGLQSFDPAAYEKTQEEAQQATKMAEMAQINPEAPGAASTAADRLAYFQKLREGQVKQFDVQDASSLQNKIQALQQQANLGQTEAGRYQLLGQTFKNPEYTTGQQRLDQLLLQKQLPQQQALKNIQQNLAKPAEKSYKDLIAQAGQENINLSQQAQGVKSDIWKRLTGTEAPAKDASGQMITQAGGLIPNLEQQINSEVTAAGTKATADSQALKDKITTGKDVTADDLKQFLPAGTSDDQVKQVLDYYNQSRPETLQNKIINKAPLNDKDLTILGNLLKAGGQDFTQDQLKRAYDTNAGGFADKMVTQFAQNQMAGADTRTGDWKMDFSKYLNGADTSKLNAANTANSEEYARYAALEALAGQNPNFINPNNIAQAGTGNANAGAFDINNAQAEGQQVFNPPTLGNMGHVAAPPGPPGSTLLSDTVMGLSNTAMIAPAALNIVSKVSDSVGIGKIDIPVISSIAEDVSGSIASLGQVITGGRVICTELYEQGRLSRDVWEYEVNYGKYLRKHDPHVIPGYHLWAIPLVQLMKKSHLITVIVDFCAKPWTNIEIREKTIFGKVYMLCALNICRVIGKSLELFNKSKNLFKTKGVKNGSSIAT